MDAAERLHRVREVLREWAKSPPAKGFLWVDPDPTDFQEVKDGQSYPDGPDLTLQRPLSVALTPVPDNRIRAISATLGVEQERAILLVPGVKPGGQTISYSLVDGYHFEGERLASPGAFARRLVCTMWGHLCPVPEVNWAEK